MLRLLCVPALTLGRHAAASTSKLRGGMARRTLATVSMSGGGEGLRQPDHARWKLCFDEPDASSPPPATNLLVVQKDGYDAWLASQTPARQSWIAAAGYEAFEDGGIVLLPGGASEDQRPETCVFMTSDAAQVHAFSSLPSRLPKALSPYQIEMADGGPPPDMAGLSWGLGSLSLYTSWYCRPQSLYRLARGE